MMNWKFKIYFYSFVFCGTTLKKTKFFFFCSCSIFFFFPSHIQLQAEERLKKDSLVEGNLLGGKPACYESDTFICFCGEGVILN